MAYFVVYYIFNRATFEREFQVKKTKKNTRETDGQLKQSILGLDFLLLFFGGFFYFFTRNQNANVANNGGETRKALLVLRARDVINQFFFFSVSIVSI